MIESVELFRELNSRELEQVKHIVVPLTFNRGEFVFRQGDFSRDFYIIQTGQVEISVRDLFNEKKVLNVLKTGDFFGEMALFDKNSTRSASVQALQTSVLLKIPGTSFESLLSEKPSISFKLLGALSKRLKDANAGRENPADAPPSYKGQILAIASARSGTGKTILATSLAHLIANELPHRVLFIDLDLYYGDGTFLMGVFSPKSVVTFAHTGVKSGINNWDGLVKHLVKHRENLYSLPAPKDFLEGEKLEGPELVEAIKVCRKYFDYIILDTASIINDVFLSSLDLADRIIFLGNFKDQLCTKSTIKFFQGLSTLNIPASRVTLLSSRCKADFDPQKVQKMIPYPILGSLPEFAPLPLEQYPSYYHFDPKGSYCNVLRQLMRDLYQEKFPANAEEDGSFFRFLFASPKPKDPGAKLTSATQEESPLPQIPPEALKTLLKEIRNKMISGNLSEAYSEGIRLLDIFTESTPLYQVVGEIAMVMKNFSLALDAFRKAVAMDPANHLAMGYIGHLANDEDFKARSFQVIEEKLAQTPDFPDLHADRGKLYAAANKHAEAEKSFSRALELNPRYTEARVLLAQSLAQQQQFPMAIQQLRLIDPKTLRINYMLGTFHYATGNFYEALGYFNKVFEENAQYMDVATKVSELRDYFKKLNHLLVMHQDLAKNHPHYPDLHYKLGNLHLLVGQKKQALEEFKTAFQLNPTYQEANLKATQLEEMLKTQEETPAHPHLATDPSMHVPPFHFECLLEATSVPKSDNNCAFAIGIKNPQTGQLVTANVTPDVLTAGRIVLDCTHLQPLHASDLLLVQLLDQLTKSQIATTPHFLTDPEIEMGRVRKSLSPKEALNWHYQAFQGPLAEVPVHHFYVTLKSPTLARLMVSNPGLFRSEFVNPNTNCSAIGKVHGTDVDTISYVFSSTDGKDVVRTGDKLTFTLNQKDGEQVFSMDFAILKEDIDEFHKRVDMEILDLFLRDETNDKPQAREQQVN